MGIEALYARGVSIPDVGPEDLLGEVFRVAVSAVAPERCLRPYLPARPANGRLVVAAVGKAAASMAKVAFDHYGEGLEGVVVTRYGHGEPDLPVNDPRLTYVEAGHPVPDALGEGAARALLSLAKGLGADDHLLCLVSGGGSSLLALPGEGVSLKDKQELTKALLACGASIKEINCVRKHLSGIKGGRLALAAYPAKITTLVISDVAGDDPTFVASGPTLADPTTLGNARRILELYNIPVSPAVESALANPDNETPKPEHPAFAGTVTRVVARSKLALEAAGQLCHAHGFRPVYLGDDLEGDASELGTVHAALALYFQAKGEPVALISGGECTVRLNGKAGAGGPNGEYLLSLAIALNGAPGIHALACDTDGIDGSEDNAGAHIGPDTLERLRAAGDDPAALLSANQSYAAFKAVGSLIITGPTRTNVNDLRVILVEKSTPEPANFRRHP